MLDLHKLHAFVVVVEERNITHAANRLFIQQPPLTRLLKKTRTRTRYTVDCEATAWH